MKTIPRATRKSKQQDTSISPHPYSEEPNLVQVWIAKKRKRTERAVEDKHADDDVGEYVGRHEANPKAHERCVWGWRILMLLPFVWSKCPSHHSLEPSVDI